MTEPVTTLAQYPYVVLRVRCDECRRAHAYRLVRLGQAYGADVTIDEVMNRLFHDCPWLIPGRMPRKYEARCLAYLPDLRGTPPPPDLPSGMMGLRLVSSRDEKRMLVRPNVDERPTRRRKP